MAAVKESPAAVVNRLQERDFIQDTLSKNPLPFWLWLVLLILLLLLFWGISSWFNQQMDREVSASPFLQVTNRQFSLFLWEFPQYMRSNSRLKTGYLTGFQSEGRESLVAEEADKYVVAPPELLFLYHTWRRLISGEYAPRPIPSEEFKEFLSSERAWQPKYWPEAPKAYQDFVAKLPEGDLQKASDIALPEEERRAFQGWRNYYKEGKEIEAVQPTFEEMRHFLELYPHYARNYWRNILLDEQPRYLIQMGEQLEGKIPKEQLAPFLKVAFYNYKLK